jgi:hypothetical protein
MHKLRTSKRERSDANPLSIFGPIGFIIIVVAVIMGVFVLIKFFTPVQYHIQVDTSPQGAEVLLLNREPLKTPCDFYIKTSDNVVNFVIQKDGYETLEESILLEKKDTILNYKLNEVRSEETVSMPMVPINKGLSSPAVYKIEESQDGALYLLLENGIIFSKNNDDFTVLYRGSPSDFTITPNGIFIVEGNSKLILLNSKGQNKIAPTPFSMARALYYSEKNNTLFIGCQSGLYSYNPENRQFIQLNKNIVGISNLYLSSKYLYIFANEYTNDPYLINLYRYDTETKKLSTVKSKIDAAFIGKNKLFIAMHRGNDVEILSSVEDTNRFASVGMITDIPPDLNHLYVLSDKIYFSTFDGGLYANEGNDFKKIGTFAHIASIGEYNNKLIIGTMRNGLIEDPISGNPQAIPIDVLTPPLYFLHSQDILVSARGEGVYQYNEGKWINVLSFKEDIRPLEQAFSEAKFQGEKFVGTDRGVYIISNNVSNVNPPNYSGLSRNFLQNISNSLYDFSESGIYYFDNNVWERVDSNIPVVTVRDGTAIGEVIMIRNIIFHNNIIYVLTESNGIIIYSDGGKTASILKGTEGKFISAMCISPQGTFVASENGLYLIEDNQTITSLPCAIGYITSIVCNNNSVYFGSSNGLFQFKSGAFFQINKEDLHAVISMKVANNNIFVSTGDCVYKLDFPIH